MSSVDRDLMWRQTMVSAAIDSRDNLDKAMLHISIVCVGAMFGIGDSPGFNTLIRHFMYLSLILFVIAIVTLLFIFKYNAKRAILNLRTQKFLKKELEGVDKILNVLDKISFGSCIMAIVFATVVILSYFISFKL